MREDHLALLKEQFGEEKIAQCMDVLIAYSQLIAPSLVRLADLDQLIRANQIEAAKIQRQKYQELVAEESKKEALIEKFLNEPLS